MSDFLLLENGNTLGLEDDSGSLLLEEDAPVSTPSRFWYGSLWPLSTFVIGVPGTGAALTQGMAAADLESSEYNEAVSKGVMISCPSTNLGTVYLVMRKDGAYSKDEDGTVVLTIGPGQVGKFPQGSYAGNRYEFSMFGIDGDTPGDRAYPCMIMQ